MSISWPILTRRLPRVSMVSMVLVVGFITAEFGNAQQQGSSDMLRGANPTRADSIAAIAAWAKSDTGRMMPGYRDLSSYDTPGMCLAAMQGVREAIWRRGESDTMPLFSPSDTSPAVMREIGRTCLARMTPQSVDSADLYDLMRAALKAGDTALARSALVYHASKVTNIQTRAGMFLDAIGLALQTKWLSTLFPEIRPTQPEWAESVFALLLELGPDAIIQQRRAVLVRRVDAYERFDTAALIRINTEFSTYVRDLIAGGRIRDSFDLGDAFRDSIALARYQRDPHLLETIRRLGDQYVAMYAGDSIEHLMAAGNIDGDLGTAKIYGTPAPSTLKLFRHYPADAPTGPVPGRVTIVGFIKKLGAGFTEPYLEALRRLHKKYHARGLDILLIAQTQGFAWGSPPLDSAQEAKLIGWYYRDHLKLPFTIFVAATEFGRLSDGRITRPFSKAIPKIGPRKYWGERWGYIVARDGTIVNQIGITDRAERMEAELDAYVRRELDIQARVQK